MNHRTGAAQGKAAIFWVVVALCTAIGVFVLPLWFPPSRVAFSSSYVAGFNNRIAVLVTLALSVIVTAALYVGEPARRTSAASGLKQSLTGYWAVAGGLVTCAYTAFFGYLAIRSGAIPSDAEYFLTQLAKGAYGQGRLYHSIDFAYGPVLFYWPAMFQHALGRIGVGPEAAYLVALAAMQVLGLGVLFYIVRHLDMGRGLKLFAFAVLGAASLWPALGMNYTLVRFGTALAALIWISLRRGIAAQTVLFGVGEIAMLSISPEVGIAFLGGGTVYALARMWRERRGWMWVCPGLFAGFGAFCLCVDPSYFYGLAHFGSGMLNMVVSPVPNVLILLVAAVGLAPMAVAGQMKGSAAEGAVACGFYAISLAMLPAALGLCDDLHTFFNGIGLYLLALVALDGASRRWTTAWSVAFLATVTFTPVTWAWSIASHDLKEPPGFVARQDVQVAQRIEAVAGPDKVYAPAGGPYFVIRQLMRDGRLAESYFCGFDDAFDLAGEQRKVGEMRQAMYVLVPASVPDKISPDNRLRVRLLRFGYTYRERHSPFQPFGLVAGELREHYKVVGSMEEGAYLLYRRKD